MTDSAKIVVRDDLGQTLVFDEPPRRIVSLVPSITETVIDLGATDQLVGITNYCVHPARIVKDLRKIGGTKGFSFEKIDDARPDLILANKEENRKHHIDKLRESYPVFVTYPRTVEQATKMILDLGALTGTSLRASEFATACDHLLGSMEPALIGRRLRTVCMIWRDPWMAAGPDTYMSKLLERVGFANVLTTDDGRYPETTLDAIVEHKPDVIILPDEPYEFDRSDQDELDAFLKERGATARTLLADGSYLTWFGTRTVKGLQFLYETRAKLMRA